MTELTNMMTGLTNMMTGLTNMFMLCQKNSNIKDEDIKDEEEEDIRDDREDPKYGKKSYILLYQDGTISEEIFETPPMEKMFGWAYEFKTICYLSNDEVSEASSTNELFPWLKTIDSGVRISLVMSEYGKGQENLWLKERGFGGIIGDVILIGETSSGNIIIPIKDSLDIVENYLNKSGKTVGWKIHK
jgi:hypothetical protein